MTKEDLIAMAGEAGFELNPTGKRGLGGRNEFDESILVGEYPCGIELEKFASLVSARTREECADRCEKAAKQISDPIVLGDEVHAAGVNVCMNLARIIRAMGERT